MIPTHAQWGGNLYFLFGTSQLLFLLQIRDISEIENLPHQNDHSHAISTSLEIPAAGDSNFENPHSWYRRQIFERRRHVTQNFNLDCMTRRFLEYCT